MLALALSMSLAAAREVEVEPAKRLAHIQGLVRTMPGETPMTKALPLYFFLHMDSAIPLHEAALKAIELPPDFDSSAAMALRSGNPIQRASLLNALFAAQEKSSALVRAIARVRLHELARSADDASKELWPFNVFYDLSERPKPEGVWVDSAEKLSDEDRKATLKAVLQLGAKMSPKNLMELIRELMRRASDSPGSPRATLCLDALQRLAFGSRSPEVKAFAKTMLLAEITRQSGRADYANLITAKMRAIR
ncbi:MAG: hypothetical protein HY921_03685 [Elusimicrobia bacterium]|nr:hypothetical protein [Elusimicrobiota bacterium]